MGGVKKKTKSKLKFKKKPSIKPKTTEDVDYLPVDKDNKRIDKVLNTTGLDVDKLGNIGKFIKMDDNELEKHVPKGGKGHGNTLTEDETDSRLVLVHRMQLRGFTQDEMAEKLEISTRMVAKIKVQIREVHRRSFVNIDVNEWLGSTIAFFEEVRDVSMLISSASTNTPKDRITALNCACNSEMHKLKFLDYCGIFNHIKSNQDLISEVVQHKTDVDVDEVKEVMDNIALSLFNV